MSEKKTVKYLQNTELETLIQRAEQGDANAQSSLAIAYSNGTGTTKDDIKSVYWNEKAAVQGHKRAQYNLGFAYRSGWGVAVDKKRHWIGLY